MLTNPRDAFRGQSRSPNIVPLHMLGIVSYSCEIVTLSLRRAIFPIFNFKNGVILKSRSEVTQGHSKWYHSIDWVGFLLAFFSNFVPEMHRFWDIRLQKYRDLENRVRGPSRSLEISPFDRAHTTSYWCPIVTIWLYLVSFLRYSMSKN